MPIFFVIALGMLLAYQVVYRDAIFPHILVNGEDIGGLTRPEARERLDRTFRGYAERPITLRAGEEVWTLSPVDLGLRSDVDRLVEEAFQFGRSGSLLDRLIVPIRLRHGSSVPTAPTLTPKTRTRAIDQLAAAIDRPPVDARLRLSEAGVAIVPEIPGRTLNREVTVRRLTGAIEGLRSDPIDLAVDVKPPAVTGADLVPVAERARALLARPARLTDGDRAYPIDPAVVRAAIRFTGSGSRTTVDLVASTLRSAIVPIAGQIDRPAREASLAIAGTSVRLDPGQSGRNLDTAGSSLALRAALLEGTGTAELVVAETPPSVTPADLAAARAAAGTILAAPVTVRAPGEEWRLAPTDLAGLIDVRAPAGGRPAEIVFDRAALTKRVKAWAAEIDRSAVAPRLAWNGGNVSIIRPGRRGAAVRVEAAAAAVEQAARSNDRTIDLPIATWGQAITSADLPALGIRERIADAATSYAGSIPERAHNVELAVRRLNGTVVAPGEQFSFNAAVGPTTVEAGFDWGFGIVNTGHGLQTVPSVAGGICQVATTLFQPVFAAGYQIESRTPHSYWIPKYAWRGIPGLDTTVDEPTGLDFRFTNNSPHHLLIEARTEGQKVIFNLYGTKPDWQVTVLDPVIRDRARANQAVVRETSDWLPAGETVNVESAADGFTVTVTRIVTEAGRERRDSLTSRYEPARNVVLVGTGRGGGQRAAAPRPAAG